jgi:hypothetical protein
MSFELTLHGGAIERRYRKGCPELEALPWGTLDRSAFGPVEIDAARFAWTRAAFQEYASTTVHARVVEDMLRAAMPLDVIAIGARAQLEELAHAELAGRMAMELGGGAELPFDPQARALNPPPPRGSDPTLVLAERALWAMAVSETFSQAMLAAAARRATHPLLAGVRGIFARDEAAHARLGWTILETLLPEVDEAGRARLRGVAAGAIGELEKNSEAVLRSAPGVLGPISALGAFEPEEYRDLAMKTIEERIVSRLAGYALV